MQDSAPSLRRRFAWKIGGAASTAASGILTALLAPKALGPAAYGDFSFCLSFFQRWLGFLDFGASSALFTRLSQRPEDGRLPAFFWRYFALLGGITLLVIPAVFGLSLNSVIFPDQVLENVLLGMGVAVFLRALLVVQGMVDAHGLTVEGEKARILQRSTGALIILILFLTGVLTLRNFFLYNMGAIGLGILLGWWVLRRGAAVLFPRASLTRSDYQALGADFSSYCRPLVLGSTLTALASLAERWMLQAVGGSEQQGYFAVSVQVATLCFLISEALRPLLFREFARIDLNTSRDRARQIYLKAAPALYVLACYLGCFTAVYAEAVGWLLDARFAGATMAVSAMSLYPLHQTYGQLSSALVLARSRTRLYAKTQVFQAVATLILTAYLVAPRAMGGWELGALGLGLAMLVVQFVGVNMLILDNARLLKLSFPRLLFHQFVCPACFLSLALLAKIWLGHPIVAGLIYSLLSIPLVRALVRPNLLHPAGPEPPRQGS